MPSIISYHQNTTNYFKEQSSIWNFFTNHKHKEEHLKEFKTDLLKNTYKFDEVSDAILYQKVAFAREKLNLPFPVTIYQAQNNTEINASIAFVNEEAHIVFSGNLIQSLSEEELLAIIAHELSHVHLYQQLNGDMEVADRIVTAIGNHPGSTPAHYESARLFRLYTEIFCDRGAYLVTGDYAPVVSSLVKLATGLQTVNADSYIKQAEEIFAADTHTRTLGITHPENFIRARAIWLWHTKGISAEPIIKEMIEGHTGLDELDLFQQHTMSSITKEVIQLLIHPAWMQTASTIALAVQYFGGLELKSIPDKTKLSDRIQHLHPNLQEYLAYVLYDFVTADKALEDVPLGYCFFIADELKLAQPFASAVKKERKLTEKKTATLKKQTLTEFQKQELETA